MSRLALRGWWVACLLLAAALFVPFAARAQDVLPVPALSGRVIDQTGTLNAAQAQALTAKLEALEHQRGSQVVVLLVPTTQPEDIAAYAQRVADTWKIGRKQVGDGVLILVAKNDRRMRIEVAKALEGAIPDLAAKQIIDQRMQPAFRAGDFAGGLNLAIDRIGERIGAEGLPEPTAPGRSGAASKPGPDLGDLAIFLLIGAPVVGSVLSAVLGRKLGSLATAGAVGAVGWWLTASLLIAGAAGLLALLLVGVMGVGSRRGGGFGGPPIIWGGGGSSGWGGGGGFSSGGGGDFGGGGASGSW
jgi:uncharacterized protein